MTNIEQLSLVSQTSNVLLRKKPLFLDYHVRIEWNKNVSSIYEQDLLINMNVPSDQNIIWSSMYFSTNSYNDTKISEFFFQCDAKLENVWFVCTLNLLEDFWLRNRSLQTDTTLSLNWSNLERPKKYED